MLIKNNTVYDATKYFTQIVLPAFGTLYFALAGIWGLPAADQVVGTVVAVDTFLGIILGISSKAYDKSDAKYDGVIQVEEKEDGGKVASMILKNYENPAEIVNQDEVLFKVNKQVSK